MLSILLESSSRATLVILAAAILLRVLRIRSASARHAVWAALTATMLLLPIIVVWAPSLRLPVLSERPLRAPLIVETSAPTETTIAQHTPAAVTEVPVSSAAIPWQSLALAAHAACATFFLLRLAVGTHQVHRLLADSVLDCGQPVHPACAAPITVGWLRPKMILPVSWTGWPPEQLHAVVTHEKEHVRRRDPLVQWIALLNRAIFWFHPLAWWLERELAKLAEEACDEAVLAQGIDSADYSTALLFLARTTHEAGTRIRLGTAMPGPGLPSRLRAILDGARPQRVSRLRLACVAIMIGMAVVGFSTGKLVEAQTARVFEVASIKPHEREVRYIGVSISGTAVNAVAMTVRNLLTYAYDVRDFQVEGGARWADEDRYDISARAPGGVTPTQQEVRAMLLALLKERFHLQERKSSKEMPIYALVVSPKGHRLKSPEKAGDPERMILTGPGRESTARYWNATLPFLVKSFSFQRSLDRPLIDQTGLTGKYDFAFTLTSNPDGTVSGPSGESMFTAIEEQLGLKLEPKKAQVDVIVIDQAERPTEN